MPSLPIRYRPAATQELSEAIGWYGERNPRVANEFRQAVRAKLRDLARNPLRWPLEPDGTRHVLVGHFPYVLIVRENRGTLELVAVTHTSREPGYWKDRLLD